MERLIFFTMILLDYVRRQSMLHLLRRNSILVALQRPKRRHPLFMYFNALRRTHGDAGCRTDHLVIFTAKETCARPAAVPAAPQEPPA
jgi:hypothetical protein